MKSYHKGKMELKHLLKIFVVVAAIDAATPSAIPKAVLLSPELVLSYPNNEDVSIIEDHPSGLPSVGAISYCVAGVWIIYPDENYVGGTPRVIFSVNREMCGTMEGGVATVASTRIAGLRPDNAAPSVTFFSGYNFNAEQIVFGESLSDVTFSLESYITINAPELEVFEHSNYEGESVCIRPTNCSVDGVCLIWWFGPGSLPWRTDPKSAKVGCGSSAKIIEV